MTAFPPSKNSLFSKNKNKMASHREFLGMVEDFRTDNCILIEDRVLSAKKQHWQRERERMQDAVGDQKAEETPDAKRIVASHEAKVADMERTINLQSEQNRTLQLRNTTMSDKVLQLEAQLATRDRATLSLQEKLKVLTVQLAEAEVHKSEMAARMEKDKDKVLQLKQQLTIMEDNVLSFKSNTVGLTRQIAEANNLNINMAATLDQEKNKLEQQLTSKDKDLLSVQSKAVGIARQFSEAARLNGDVVARLHQEKNKNAYQFQLPGECEKGIKAKRQKCIRNQNCGEHAERLIHGHRLPFSSNKRILSQYSLSGEVKQDWLGLSVRSATSAARLRRRSMESVALVGTVRPRSTLEKKKKKSRKERPKTEKRVCRHSASVREEV
ncbi:uncharacterized protein V6R79_015361 [Siganus canaliculatus]